MKRKQINYEEMFMDVRAKKPKTYFLSKSQDYRLYSLVKMLTKKDGRLLDVGCGGGVLTESLSFYFPKLLIDGCDISKTAISFAKKSGSGKVSYKIIKNKKIPYKANLFDVIICLDVLEHVPDINTLLKEIRRVLKDDGEFFIVVPCEGERFTHTWLFKKLHFGENMTYRYFGHIHPEYTQKYVLNLLKKNGFKIQKKAYSEHIFSQLMHILLLFLPKYVMELIIGEVKISEYTHNGLISSPKNKLDPIYITRGLWLGLYNFVKEYPMFWETIILRNFPFAAWKIHVLAEKEIKK